MQRVRDMMGIVHLIFGAALGSLSKSSFEAAAAGWSSHLLLDSLPHRDLGLKGELLTDVVLLSLLLPGSRPDCKALAGAMAAVAPDAENMLYKLGWIAKRDMSYPSHSGQVPHGPRSFSVLEQGLLMAGALYILKRKKVII